MEDQQGTNNRRRDPGYCPNATAEKPIVKTSGTKRHCLPSETSPTAAHNYARSDSHAYSDTGGHYLWIAVAVWSVRCRISIRGCVVRVVIGRAIVAGIAVANTDTQTHSVTVATSITVAAISAGVAATVAAANKTTPNPADCGATTDSTATAARRSGETGRYCQYQGNQCNL
jgi:hypothetical protein